MNPFWKQVIINTVLKKEQEKPGTEADYTSFQLAKGFRRFMQSVRRIAKDAILMAIGIISAAFGLESFLIPNNFIDGGATGISLLATEVTGIPLYYFIILINLPFIFLGYKVYPLFNILIRSKEMPIIICNTPLNLIGRCRSSPEKIIIANVQLICHFPLYGRKNKIIYII